MRRPFASVFDMPLINGILWIVCDLNVFLYAQVPQQQQPPPPPPPPVQKQKTPDPKPFGEDSRFEFMHSFRAPGLTHKDGRISYWTVSGDAMPSTDQIRLAPSMKSKAGSVWNTKPMVESEFWAVDLNFRIAGLGTLGADGMAFWYTQSMGQKGSVFGSSDKWVGLGIFLDSYANDNTVTKAPFIGLMINDGTKEYNQAVDGGDAVLKRYVYDFRNKRSVKIRIVYLRNVVSVYVHNNLPDNPNYDLCFTTENTILLPRNGYFGVSAATGGLYDDHDVMSFETWSYSPVQTRMLKTATMSEAEKIKLKEDFEKQRRELEQAKERYMKEHPEIAQPDQEIETPVQRGIRQVLEMQSSTYAISQHLSAQFVQIAQMQQNILTLLGQQASQIQQVAQPGSGQPAYAAIPGPLERNEVVEMLQILRDASSLIRDVKNYVVDVQNRVMVVDQRLVSAASIAGGQQPQLAPMAGSDADFTKSHLEAIKREVEQIRLHQRTQSVNCPSFDSNCLSSTVFLIAILVQTTVFIVYMMFKGRNQKAKFY